MPQLRQSILRQGVVTGFIGATAVALWFLIVDLVAGRPLYTPHVLGAGVFGVLGPPAGESAALLIAAYTVFHYAAFTVIGIVLAAIVARSEDDAAVLAGLAVFVVIFQVGFFGLTALLSEWSALGNLAWYQLGAANLVALLLMGGYLYRAHPRAARRLADALGGRT